MYVPVGKKSFYKFSDIFARIDEKQEWFAQRALQIFWNTIQCSFYQSQLNIAVKITNYMKKTRKSWINILFSPSTPCVYISVTHFNVSSNLSSSSGFLIDGPINLDKNWPILIFLDRKAHTKQINTNLFE